MQSNTAPLPVPMDQIQAPYISNANELPQLPQALGGSAQQLGPQQVGQLHAKLIQVLQGKVEQNPNPFRIFMINLAAQNYYQNEVYAHFLNKLCDVVLACQISGSQFNPDEVATEVVDTELPRLVQTFPQLQQAMNQGIQQTLMRLEQRANELRDFVARSFDAMNQPGMQGGGGFQPNMGAGNRPSAGWGHVGHRAGGGMMANANTQGAQWNTAPSFGMGPTTPQGQPNRPSQASHRAQLQRQVESESNQGSGCGQGWPESVKSSWDKPTPYQASLDTTGVISSNENRGQSTMPSDDQKFTPEQEQELASRLRETVDGDDNIHQVPDEWLEGEVFDMPPAYRSDQKLVELGDGRYQITDREGDMRYEDHEDRGKLISYHRQHTAGPKIEYRQHWQAVEHPQPIELDPSSYSEEDEIDTQILEEKSLALEEVQEALSIDHAIAIALDSLSERVDPLSDRIIEFDAKIHTPIHISEDEIEPISRVINTSRDRKVTTLIENLADAKDKIRPYIWYLIHDRLNERFNETLSVLVAPKAGIEVDSFMEDFAKENKGENEEDVLDLIAEIYREDSPAYERCCERLYEAMHRCLRLITRHEYDDKLWRASLCEAHSVTMLPWSSEQIHIALPGKYNLLSTAADKTLFDAVVNLMERTRGSDSNINRRWLVTSDRVFFELVEGNTRQQIFIRKH